MKILLLTAGMAIVAACGAQVIPNGFENTAANGVFALTSTSGTAGRTYQMQIDSSQLTSYVGMNLNGLKFRLNESATADWPNATADFSQWDIYIGPGVDPTARSVNFAENFTSTPTQVRSGGLTINAASFSSSGSPTKPFGPAISFSDYLYSGGDLTIELRFSQQIGGNSASFDGATSSTTGYGTLFAASWAASSTATSATNSFTANFLVTELSAAPVPEPATLAVLGIGALAALKRRKRK